MHRLKFIIPNACTALSMLLGLASINTSIDGNYELAAWMILWAVLLDKLDGAAARLFDACSDFGARFDSYADFVSFGIAPAALFVFALRDPKVAAELVNPKWMMAAAGVYAVAVAVRLARFDTSSPPMGERVFYGIPTTVMGGVLSTGFLTFLKFDLSPELIAPMPFVLLGCAFAMISNIMLPKMQLRYGTFFNAFLLINVLFAYALGVSAVFHHPGSSFDLYPEVMFFQGVFYPSLGIIYCWFKPPKMEQEDTLEFTEEEAQVVT